MAAMYGLMPMAGYAAYAPIYYHTVNDFPAAQFFFAASLNVLIMIIFIVIQLTSVSYSASRDLEKSTVAVTDINTDLQEEKSGLLGTNDALTDILNTPINSPLKEMSPKEYEAFRSSLGNGQFLTPRPL